MDKNFGKGFYFKVKFYTRKIIRQTLAKSFLNEISFTRPEKQASHIFSSDILLKRFPLAKGNECDCRDWYGSCRRVGDDWVDDLTWSYSCDMEALKTTRCDN